MNYQHLLLFFGLLILLFSCHQNQEKNNKGTNKNTEIENQANDFDSLVICKQTDVKKTIKSDGEVEETTINWMTYHGSNNGVNFSIQYPSDWTFQEFRCNLHGVAFCVLSENKESDCGYTCEMDSKVSPINLYFYGIESDLDNGSTEKSTYWKVARARLTLDDEQYKSVYSHMISTFQIVSP